MDLMKKSNVNAPVAYHRKSDLGSTIFYMGSVLSFLAKGEETGGRFALMGFQSKPGNEPPPHVHEWEHELYYVLEGMIEAYCEDKILIARAGEAVFLPQGKPHAFYIRSPRLRALILVQATGEHAVGLDRYFIGMGEPATSMNIPADAITHIMDDPNHAIGVASKNGVRILSPEEAAKELPRYPGLGANLSGTDRLA